MIDKRNTRNEKNAQTQRDRNTTADMDEARGDGDDDDEGGNSEDEDGEYEDGKRMGSMRMGQEARVIGQPRTPNGDRLVVFTSQPCQEQ